jgi:DNA-binding NarL/FixJ family response regulator
MVPARTTAADSRGRLAGLTEREREILGHLLVGRTTTEIATALVISDKTVSVRVFNISARPVRRTGRRRRH